jgi:hypothetical protein
MMYHWHFNDLPGGTLQEVPASISISGEGMFSYPGSGAGYMDRTDAGEGSVLNGIPEVVQGNAIRVRNPSEGRYLLIESPSIGHRDPILSFATMRTSNGPQLQQVHFTTDPARDEWQPLGEPYPVFAQYQIKTFSLEGITGAYDQAHLAFKVEFLGPEAAGMSGNARFDNVTVMGRPIAVLDAILCEEGTFNHGDFEYAPGTHLHMNEEAMDCDQVVLVHVQVADLDTNVTTQGNVLSVAEQEAGYQWIDCEAMSLLPGEDQHSFRPQRAGHYAVRLSHHHCEEISACHFAPGDDASGISVYPNPAADVIHVAFTNYAVDASYRLLDQTGRLVREGPLEGSLASIQVHDLSRGVYMLHVRYGSNGQNEQWSRQVLR